MNQKRRCRWCNCKNPSYVAYHDMEWCQPNFDEHHLYEMMILESFQAGLSWECVLNKRESFRLAYDNFDLDKVCAYGQEKITQLRNNPAIIRNKLKIQASISNSIRLQNVSNAVCVLRCVPITAREENFSERFSLMRVIWSQVSQQTKSHR